MDLQGVNENVLGKRSYQLNTNVLSQTAGTLGNNDLIGEHLFILTVAMDRDDYMSALTGETFYGNIIAEFSRESEGEAIAESRDKTGKVWWFVIMDKTARTTTNHFYDDENGYKTGWMSTEFPKRIK